MHACMHARSPARTVLLLRARPMLVAQLGSCNGGSTPTAAVVHSTECQPREFGDASAGRSAMHAGRADTEYKASQPATRSHRSASSSRGRPLSVVSVRRLVPGSTALGPHKVTPGEKRLPCNTSTHVSGCTEWHLCHRKADSGARDASCSCTHDQGCQSRRAEHSHSN